MQTKFNMALLACAAVALIYTGYREMTAHPQPRAVSDASCAPEAIKGIANITERAIHVSKCAQRAK
ncbi:hypothetical protein [Duganella callida]|uniref:Entry exclusion lipoprotein TrbK n=1 Tax=Duganella callida TaxID=2561932 RepID=A0A4Y9RX45_9BURK|nr:hypothetical protein [Duganella callida]TFW13847.1 hypothetical protein E4L98_28305 [Duganella callida]